MRGLCKGWVRRRREGQRRTEGARKRVDKAGLRRLRREARRTSRVGRRGTK